VVKKSAIGPLHKIINDPEIPDYLKNKAEYAISKIKSSVGDTDEGWLSVAVPFPAGGALSLKENTPEGSLSISDTDTTQDEVSNE